MDGEQIKTSCFSPDLLPTGGKKLQTHTRTREEALMSCYLNLLPSSDPQWGLHFFPPLIYNPVSHHVMTSPREFDFTNTQTHLTGNRMNPWAILGSVQHHPSSTPQAPSLPKTSFAVAVTEPPIFQALRAAWGDFCAAPVSGSIRPHVLVLHPHCALLPRAGWLSTPG